MFGIQINLNNLGHADSDNWDQQARKKEFSRHRNFRSIKNRFPGVRKKRISLHKKSAHHFFRSLSRILIYTVLCYMVLVVTFVLDMTLR